jgi:hypothetical protein
MTTTELKKKLIRKIYKLDDDLLLEEMSRMVGIESDEEIYHLSEKQLREVEEARQQYLRGEYVSNEGLEKEIEEWLKE